MLTWFSMWCFFSTMQSSACCMPDMSLHATAKASVTDSSALAAVYLSEQPLQVVLDSHVVSRHCIALGHKLTRLNRSGMQADIMVNLMTGVEDSEGNRDYSLSAIAYVSFTPLPAFKPLQQPCLVHPSLCKIAPALSVTHSCGTPEVTHRVLIYAQRKLTPIAIHSQLESFSPLKST